MTRTPDAWTANLRRIPFVTECVTLWLAAFVDAWFTYLHPLDGDFAVRAISSLATLTGLAIAVVALFRRKRNRPVLTTALAAAASLLVTILVVQGRAAEGMEVGRPTATEVVGLALLVGAMCRRSSPQQVIPVAVLAGAAMTLSPLLRLGVDSDRALLAVPAAVAWGASVGIGLVLRDADNLRLAAREATREAERLNLARELHDFVAHHVTGIVVLAQGAQIKTPTPTLAEIERAGTEAMTAMRRLVGALRTDAYATLEYALKDACGNDQRVRLEVPSDLTVPPELLTTTHRIVLESVTNARRHGTPGSPITVTASLADDQLVLQVVNEVAPGKDSLQNEGYGLIGMAERVRALGGTLAAGRRTPRQWEVTATLPTGDR